MSFREIAITIRAVNRASHEFAAIERDSSVMVKHLIAGFSAAGVAAVHFAGQIGLITKEQARYLSSAFAVISAVASLSKLFEIGAVKAVAHQIALFAQAAAAKAAAIANWFLNTSLIVQVGLITLGIGLLTAMVAILWALKAANEAAAESAREFTEAMQSQVGALSYAGKGGRGIMRAGEEELYRRGLESP